MAAPVSSADATTEKPPLRSAPVITCPQTLRIDSVLIITITTTFLPGFVRSFLTLLPVFLSARMLSLNRCRWLRVILSWSSLPLDLLLWTRDNRRVQLMWPLNTLLP